MTNNKPIPEKTSFGTPCAKTWDRAWIDTVNKRYRTYNRPICGARTAAGTPCTAKPTHKNGRCPHHGGFDLTGAPEGNRNAALHGLYSRRIQTCGPHCPQWEHCPLGKHREGGDVTKQPEHERPKCPYELAEFNAVLTDYTANLDARLPYDPTLVHAIHDLAQLRVMMSRAMNALANQSLVHDTHVQAKNYSMDTKRPNPGLTAYLRLASEYRRQAALLNATPRTNTAPHTTERVTELQRRHQHDISPHPDDLQACATQDIVRDDAVNYHLNRASNFASPKGRGNMLFHLNNAMKLDPGRAAERLDAIFSDYEAYDSIRNNELRRTFQKDHNLPVAEPFAKPEPELNIEDELKEEFEGLDSDYLGEIILRHPSAVPKLITLIAQKTGLPNPYPEKKETEDPEPTEPDDATPPPANDQSSTPNSQPAPPAEDPPSTNLSTIHNPPSAPFPSTPSTLSTASTPDPSDPSDPSFPPTPDDQPAPSAENPPPANLSTIHNPLSTSPTPPPVDPRRFIQIFEEPPRRTLNPFSPFDIEDL